MSMPVPLKVTDFVPALVMMVITSLLLPVEDGLNPTAIFPDSPGARVLFCHSEALIRNSVRSARPTEVTTRSAVPVFVTEIVISFLVLKSTSPKLREEEGERLRAGAPAATPVPERRTDFV